MTAASWTDAELEQRHAEIVARFPDGITAAQWRRVTLENAREDGIVHPHSLADWFTVQSLLIGMCWDGLIERRCRRDEAGPYYITEKGRAALADGKV